MIKAVIFDFGGVTVSEGFQNWITDHIAPYATMRPSMVGMQDKVDLGDLSVSAYNDYLSQKTGKNPNEIEKEILANYFVHKDVVNLIQALRSHGIKTAIVSNFPKEWFWKVYEMFGLSGYFDVVLVSSEVHMIKPHNDFLQEALKRLQVNPDETVFIDDTKEYVEGVGKMGIHAVQFFSVDNVKAYLKQFGVTL